MRVLTLTALLAASAVAHAQIVLKPSGADAIKLTPQTVDIKVAIRGGIANSVWTYTFANAGRYEGQADFLIAIPKGGVVGGFAYWYQGEKVVARIAEKERAKRIYSAIVARQRDPALIELVGKDTFRVRVFPIDGGADLKIELKMAQAIPAGPQGATLSIPLHRLGKLEKATVEVSGENKLQTSWGGPRYAIANSKAADLRVTQAWKTEPLRASLLSERSGGPKGFFVLTLTPSKRRRAAGWKLEGPVEAVVPLRDTGRSLVLAGRFLRPGRLRVTWGGDAVEVALADRTEENGPASKLWAWNRIARSKSSKEIVALSTRFGVPSRLTSWIAIPKEERERMAQEIAEAEIKGEIAKVAVRYARVGPTSAEGQAIRRRIDRMMKAQKIDSPWLWGEGLDEATEAVVSDWLRATEKDENSPAARRRTADLLVLSRLDASTERITSALAGRARSTAEKLLTNRISGRRDGPAAGRLRRLAGQVAKLGGERPNTVGQFLNEAAFDQVGASANAVLESERTGQGKARARARLRYVARLTSQTPAAILRHVQADRAVELLARHETELFQAIQAPTPDEARLRLHAEERQRAAKALLADGRAAATDSYAFRWLAERFVWNVASGLRTLNEKPKFERETKRLADLAGLPLNLEKAYPWTAGAMLVRNRIDAFDREARNSPKELAKAKRLLESLRQLSKHAPEATYFTGRNEPAQEERDAYVKARHRGQKAETELRALDEADRGYYSQKDEAWAKARQARLQALTELDQLDRQKADPQVLVRIAELEKREKELQARMGDPIVRIAVPDARTVFARMPDGSRLDLRPARNGIWEGRFDVPPGVADGRRLIDIVVDGVLKERTPIRVDTQAPKLRVAWHGRRVEVRTDADVKRVTGLTPNGERLELMPEATGRFAAFAPVGTRFIATDGAHNRSDMAPTPPGQAGGWRPGVTALARVEGRLWAGLANDGGGFVGDPKDAARSWVKAAVTVGGRLAVRYADGEVTVDGTPIRLARHSTALAAEGDTLLVGTIGGYFDGPKPIFPPELAGVVVTALMGDGERVWLGTQGRGIAEIDRVSGTVRWHDERNGLGDDWITCFGRDRQGRVVAGTFVAGAYAFDGGWRSVTGTAGTCVAGVGDGWVATRQGVFFEGRLIDPVEATAFLSEGERAVVGTRKGVRTLDTPVQSGPSALYFVMASFLPTVGFLFGRRRPRRTS